MRPAVSSEVLRRIQIDRSGERGTVLGAIVASGDALDDPVGVCDDGRRVTFNESSGSQQLLYVEYNDATRMFAGIMVVLLTIEPQLV